MAPRAALVRRCGRPAVRVALACGDLVTVGRSYALPDVDASRAAAARVSGVVSHRSAALLWGWGVPTMPERPDVTLRRNRMVPADRLAGLTVHRAELAAEDVVDGRTSRDRTVVDCLRSLPFAEALSVADSALRADMTRSRLLALARDARGPGSAQVRRVAAVASPLAANPFESSLRAICLGVDGLRVEPQVSLRDPHWLGRPDLVDRRLMIALEADSFEWHGGREALHRDANRYNAMVAAGWLVLRFSWEEVMLHPGRVEATLKAVARERTDRACPACRAA